jgi:UTP:GlnB (protein PII) uridylyltransferase
MGFKIHQVGNVFVHYELDVRAAHITAFGKTVIAFAATNDIARL